MSDPAQVQVREALPEDNDALQALQALCPQGTGLILSAVNTPNFFARAEAYRVHRVYVAQLDGQIVGSAACAIRDGLVNGKPRKIGYEFQYFTSPAHRQLGIARRLRERIEASFVEQGAALSYALIVEGNRPSMRLFEAQGFTRHRTLTISAVLVHQVLAVPAEGIIRPIQAADFPAVARLIEETWGDRDFFEPTSAEQLADFVTRTPGYKLDDLLVLEEGGEIVACLGCWEWNRVIRITVQALSPRLRLIGLLLDLARPLRSTPRLPKIGQTLAQWVLVPVAWREPRHLTALLRTVNNRAVAEHADQLLTACERHDGLLSAMQGMFRVGVEGHLYLKALEPLSLGRNPVWFNGLDL